MESEVVVTTTLETNQNLATQQQQQQQQEQQVCIRRPVKIRIFCSGLTREEILKNALTKLENQRKLCLVLDLDHTLLHSKHLHSLSHDDSHKYLSDSSFHQEDIFRWKDKNGEEFLTKLRPYVRKFLEETSKLFQLYVYTMGSQDYLINIAKILDPQGVYFGSRLISRDKCIEKDHKGLHAVHVHPSGVIIVDDTKSVWSQHSRNLILIDKYKYFAHKNSTRRSLAYERENESEDGGVLFGVLERLKRVHGRYFNSNDSSDVRELLPIKLKLVLHQKHPSCTHIESPSSKKKQKC